MTITTIQELQEFITAENLYMDIFTDGSAQIEVPKNESLNEDGSTNREVYNGETISEMLENYRNGVKAEGVY
jgi:hypothetical protein